MKHTLYFALLITLALTTGCVVQNSTHTFQYHGTDNIAAGSEFYYVQYGLTGRSSTTYKPTGGGAVREGLVADAKRDLMQNYPLKANQAYANLSIDVIRTTKEKVGRYGNKIIEVILQCVVSADVIQYGAAPLNASENPEMQPKILSLDELGPADNSSQRSREDSSGSPQVKYTFNVCSVGDTVTFVYKNTQFTGVIVKTWSDGTIFVKHPTAKGRMRQTLISAADIVDLKSAE
jgi:hypothetical protein